MKQLYLLRGLPASGKTFVANSLSENNLYPVISADDYFEVDGEYIFDKSKLKSAHEYSKNTTKKYLLQTPSPQNQKWQLISKWLKFTVIM